MMKKILFLNLCTIVLFCSVTACAQNNNTDKISGNKNSTIKKTQKTMDLSKITNPTVNAAMTAWQNGDSKTFLSYFTDNPTMTDDGNPKGFHGFVKEACGEEKFLTIDSVENDGKDITGNFKAGKWGTFKVFFKFHQNADGKFDRLDI
ncbi:MAG TPA: hypothetical protein VF455_07065, partial [Chryseobacterium sp.]